MSKILAHGMVLLGLGAGYRRSEFETFGCWLAGRCTLMGKACEFLRLAWLGQPFEWEGRQCHITPRPEPCAPLLLLGGSSAASARRAAHIADGWFPPLDARLWQPYRDECLRLGKPDPGAYPAQGPIFLWVTDNVEKAWQLLLPHILQIGRAAWR